MINYTIEPLADGELVRFTFSDEGDDSAWKGFIAKYVESPRMAHQYFLIDNRLSLGTASAEAIRGIFQSLSQAGVTKLRVAQVSKNQIFIHIAKLTEELAVLESLNVVSHQFSTIREAECWLAEVDDK